MYNKTSLHSKQHLYYQEYIHLLITASSHWLMTNPRLLLPPPGYTFTIAVLKSSPHTKPAAFSMVAWCKLNFVKVAFDSHRLPNVLLFCCACLVHFEDKLLAPWSNESGLCTRWPDWALCGWQLEYICYFMNSVFCDKTEQQLVFAFD